MAKITAVKGREILDSRGNPTVEVTIALEDRTMARAGVPSGASTGAFEAVELRDGDPHRYGGLGVLNALSHIDGELAEAVIGMEASDQKALDEKMIALDGTENKARLGANAILGISLAVCRAAALSEGIPLYAHISKLYGKRKKTSAFPVPMFNVINGGKHSNSGLSVQEFKIVPSGIVSFPQQLRAGSEIFHSLEKILDTEGFPTGVGDEGGFAPRVESHKRQLELISDAISQAGYTRGKEIFLDLDVAADSFYIKEKDQYALRPENAFLTKESLINLYREWIHAFDIVSIEDGLHEEDWSGWAMMCEKLGKETAAWGKPLLFVGDDLLVTNVKRLQKAIKNKSCNAVLIKVNQIGTVTETLACMRLAEKAGMQRIISHRSGETVDDFIADLAVGAGAEFIKSGSLSRGERITKYNRLSEIFEAKNTKK